MAYFSNGAEGMDYQRHHCSKCVHDDKYGCPCWMAHELWNYEECNKADSILHKMIPRTRGGLSNGRCIFFVARE